MTPLLYTCSCCVHREDYDVPCKKHPEFTPKFGCSCDDQEPDYEGYYAWVDHMEDLERKGEEESKARFAALMAESEQENEPVPDLRPVFSSAPQPEQLLLFGKGAPA